MKNPSLFDSHAHLSSPTFDNQTDQLIDRAWQLGVRGIVNICTDADSLEKGLALSKKYPWIYNAGATTPHDVELEGEKMFPIFAKQAHEGAFVAIGETGLDYFYEHSDRSLQKRFLCRYLELAISCNLPVIIHCREAFEDLFTLIDSHYEDRVGLLHCFTGTEREAAQLIDRGWSLSISGIVTFKKSQPLRDVVKTIPLENILVETDAPYLAPQSQRGKNNEPSFLQETIETIARVKELSLEQVATRCYENARALFRLT